jgi:hypothetical protein
MGWIVAGGGWNFNSDEFCESQVRRCRSTAE